MSFFKKLKQGLGIGTAKVELDVPTYISKNSKEVEGKVTVTAQSDQKVKSIKVSLVEKTTIRTGNEQREQRREIQSVVLNESFEIKKDESRTVPFTLSVDLGDKVSFGLFGGTLEISASSNTPQVFEIVATVDLEGVALDPTAGKFVSFTNQP